MRPMQLLNVVMYQLDGLLGPAIACCPSTSTSNHTFAVAASSRPSKNSSTASSVSHKALPHVWLTNHVASPTKARVSACSRSSLATLQRLRDVRGLMNNWHACSTVKRPIHAPSVVFSQRRYAMETPCSSVRKVSHVTGDRLSWNAPAKGSRRCELRLRTAAAAH